MTFLQTRRVTVAVTLAFGTLLAACNLDTPEAAAPDGQDMASSAPDIAGENCILELARTANQPASMISIQNVEVDDTGPTHLLIIDGAAAPWSCKTSPNGAVIELMYTQEG